MLGAGNTKPCHIGGTLLLTTRSSWVALCVQLVEPCVVAPGLLLHSLTLPYSFPQFCHPTAMETIDQAGYGQRKVGDAQEMKKVGRH